MGAVIALFFGTLVGFEITRPLRKRVQPKLEADARNLTIAGTGAVVLALAETPVNNYLVRIVERKNWGLLRLLPLPKPVRILAGIVLLDYTLYLWHVLTHRVPLLWRFHMVHHADLDLDASTALRFHAGELLLSVPYRAAQISLLGIDRQTLQIWQNLLFLSILFHHSNIRLDPRTERMLQAFIMTPHLHGIHHDRTYNHLNTNWSSGLSFWDRLHGTFETGVPDDQIHVGIPEVSEPEQATLVRSLAMPFELTPQTPDA